MSELLSRFKCGKKTECVRCAGCCSNIREKQFLHKADDFILRKKIYEKTGILYLEPLHHYTISLTLKEKKVIESDAKKLGIKLKISPKKIVYDNKKNKFAVVDYFYDFDRCPLLDKKTNACRIYSHRPKICRDFPFLKTEKSRIYAKIDGLSFEEVLKKVKQAKKFF
jgi:Fe-S-cluster containining protein